MVFRIGTDGIRGKLGVPPIAPDNILQIGWALGKLVADCNAHVVIGKDTRISGYMFESALEAGLSAAGVDSVLFGPLPTPAVAYLTRTTRAAAGVVISASHNPYYDNGIKFFDCSGSKMGSYQTSKLAKLVNQKLTTVATNSLGRASRMQDAPGRYIEFCKSTCGNLNLKGMRIVVDTANGASYIVAPKVLRELGADVIVINSSPDGLNINLDCGSEHPGHLQRAVLDNNADCGIAFDGDADRVLFVDASGRIIHGDVLLYKIARYLNKTGSLTNSGVVGTILTNQAMISGLSRHNLKLNIVDVGDIHLLSGLRKNNFILGGEPSGHIIQLNKHSTADGMLAALTILSAMQFEDVAIADLYDDLQLWPQLKSNIYLDNAKEVLDSLLVQELVQDLRSSFDGRIIVRASGTENCLRILVEGRDRSNLDYINKELLAGISDNVKPIKVINM